MSAFHDAVVDRDGAALRIGDFQHVALGVGADTRLVNNLLDMARIQSGGFKLKKEWLTLEEVVGSALKMLEPGLGGRHIALNMPEPLTLIHVDGPLFERVLINLLENAGKYAGAKAQIGVNATVEDQALRLEVWDTGPGIPAGKEHAIFEKFARGNKESAIPGVGLGLRNLPGHYRRTRRNHLGREPPGRRRSFLCYTSSGYPTRT